MKIKLRMTSSSCTKTKSCSPSAVSQSLLERVSEKGAALDPKMMAMASATGLTMGVGVKLVKKGLTLADKSIRSKYPFASLMYGSVFLSLLYWYNPRMNKTDYLLRDKNKINGSLFDISPVHIFTRFLAVMTSIFVGYPFGPSSFAAETGVFLTNWLGGKNINDPDIKKRQQQKADLLLTGAVAAVTANYNAPVAGIMYAAGSTLRFLKGNTVSTSAGATHTANDEVEHTVGARNLPLMVIAALCAALVVRGGSPLTGSTVRTAWSAVNECSFPRTALLEVPAFAALGIAGGLWAALYERYKFIVSKSFANTRKVFQPALAAMFVWVLYTVSGQNYDYPSGMATIPKILASGKGAAFSDFVPFTMATLAYAAIGLGLGAIGGPIGAFVMAGAAIGNKFHSISYSLLPWLSSVLPTVIGGSHVVGDNSVYVAAGAIAVISACTQAPLFALTLILELSGRLDLAVPGMIAAGSALAVRRLLV